MIKRGMKIILLLFVAATVFLCGCSKDKKITPEVQFGDTIMPLAEGNYWIYRDSIYEGRELVDTEDSKIKITGSSLISYQGEQKRVYYWNWFEMPEDKPQSRKTLVRNDEGGLFYYGQKMGSSYSQLSQTLFIKYPVDTGQEWSYLQGAIIECISTSEEFETPAGIFDAYVYKVTSGWRSLPGFTDSADETARFRTAAIQYLYYVPDVGYVGMEAIENGGLVLRRHLKEYKVKQE